MNQVPADRVIAVLTQELADCHRELAILKVQVAILEENAATPAPSGPSAAVPPVPSASSPNLPALPPQPAS